MSFGKEPSPLSGLHDSQPRRRQQQFHNRAECIAQFLLIPCGTRCNAHGILRLACVEHEHVARKDRHATSGWATAAGTLLPGAQVHAIEPEGFDDTGRSLVQGARMRNRALSGTICDALLVPTPGALAFEVMRSCRVRGATVSDGEVRAAIRFGFEHLKLVLEPGGAAALAAAMFRRFPTGASGVLAILSGGNVDAEVFEQSIGHVHC
jgi:threonine dehydratase